MARDPRPARGATPLSAGGDPREIAFRPLTRGDFSLLAAWLSRPHVEPWWREPYDLDSIEARYGPCVDGIDPTELHVILLDGHPVGFLQWYRVADNPTWRAAIEGTGVGDDAAGMDYLLGDETLLGHGLGPRVLRQFLDEVLRRYPEIATVALSVGKGNRRSWRALEKLGFTRAWEGEIVSDDPSDEGLSYLYVLDVR